jgi:hypothetical protein
MEWILHNKIIIIGWLLFILCLFLPVTYEHGKYYNGFAYGMLAIDDISQIFYKDKWPLVHISGISNILAILAIFVAIIKNKYLSTTFALLYILFGVNNFYYYSADLLNDLKVGYFIWVLSFFIIGIGLLHIQLKSKSLTNRSRVTAQ